MLTVDDCEEFLAAYEKGERHFIYSDLDDSSFQNKNLKNVIFEACCLLCDFTGADLTNSRFLNCNLKAANFSNANLNNATIKKCHVEAIDLGNTNIENVKFENNYYMGIVLDQSDLILLIETQNQL